MNGIDVAVALAVVGSSVSGYRQGLLIRISTAVGGVGGLLLAAANLPWMVARLPFGDGRPGFVSILCSLVVGAVLGRFVGIAVGRWLRRHLPTRPVRQADRLAGGALGAVVVGVVVWLAAPLFAVVPGWPSRQWAGSRASELVALRLPEPPDAVGSLRFLLGNATFPRVTTSLLPGITPGSPRAALRPSVGTEAARSTVSVTARACSLVSRGTGVVVGDGLVITAAHVVAGAREVDIAFGQESVTGRVVSADARVDLALIRVERSVVRGAAIELEQVDPQRQSAVVVGRPRGVARVLPAQLTDVVVARGRDIYDREAVSRRVLVLTVALAPGDSGGPVVDADGQLIGVVFAAATDQPGTGFAVPADQVAELIASVGRGSNSARRCLVDRAG